MDTPSSQEPILPPETPVVIELHQAEKARNGTFRPQAYLKLTPVLRTSGLLLALPAEEVKNLLMLLTFVTPNGDCLATVQQLSQALHVSIGKTQSRMQRLKEFTWQGEPLVHETKTESGLDTFSPSHKLISYQRTEQPLAAASHPAQPLRSVPRDAVIAHSREHYTRPRAEVERQIEEQLGHTPPQVVPGQHPQEELRESEQAAVRRQLESQGITSEQAERLLAQYDLLRIRRQLHWLPYRKVRNRPGFLIAAIEDNYEAPLMLRSTGGTPRESSDERVPRAMDTGGERLSPVAENTAEAVVTTENSPSPSALPQAAPASGNPAGEALCSDHSQT